MKLLLGILLFSPVSLAQKAIQFTWDPGANPGWTSCTSGTHCLTGYTFYETTTGTPVVLASVPQNTTSYTLSTLPSKGFHTYTVAQNGLNGSGATVQSKGNPGIVINCWKTLWGRTCKPGKSW
jgi:hypothetical protein